MRKALVLDTPDINAFLTSSDIVDYQSAIIKDAATSLSGGTHGEIELAKKAYEFVRDNIAHSIDIGGNIVTWRASDVLKHKQGICYAKAHLLAGILRCLGIPAGFCYQKLVFSDDEEKPRLVLHGLNVLYLKSLGAWFRLDARGNKEGVNAEFSLEEEKLAFPVRKEFGEEDIHVIYASPNKNVVNALKASKSVSELISNLPSEL